MMVLLFCCCEKQSTPHAKNRPVLPYSAVCTSMLHRFDHKIKSWKVLRVRVPENGACFWVLRRVREIQVWWVLRTPEIFMHQINRLFYCLSCPPPCRHFRVPKFRPRRVDHGGRAGGGLHGSPRALLPSSGESSRKSDARLLYMSAYRRPRFALLGSGSSPKKAITCVRSAAAMLCTQTPLPPPESRRNTNDRKFCPLQLPDACVNRTRTGTDVNRHDRECPSFPH